MSLSSFIVGIALINVRINQLWKCTLGDHVYSPTTALVLTAESTHLVVMDDPSILLCIGLLCIVSYLLLAVGVAALILLLTASIYSCHHLSVILLVEDRVVQSVWSTRGLVSFKKPLTVCLMEAHWSIMSIAGHQELLLFGEISSLSVKLTSNESSTSPRYLHEILGHFLVLPLNWSFLLPDRLIYSIGILLYSLLLILLLDYVLLLGSRVLSQINGIGLIGVTTLGARGWTTMVKLSLLSHACSHEGLRIWSGPSLLTGFQSGTAMLLELEGLLNCLICIEILMGVSICSDGRIFHMPSCLNRLVWPVCQIYTTLALVLRSIRTHGPPRRLGVLLPRLAAIVLIWSGISRKVWIHFSTRMIAMKTNILIRWAKGSIIGKKIACPSWKDMNRVWI